MVSGRRASRGQGSVGRGCPRRPGDRPARHVREYLTALHPLLNGDEVAYRGETLTAAGRLDVPDLMSPALIISALGPVMLCLAGELADGTVTTWTGARAIAEHLVPGITKAAQTAGRPSPRILAGVVIALTTTRMTPTRCGPRNRCRRPERLCRSRSDSRLW
ncbi:LLM class flavin-dependent oxidoreductase [Actinoallomurus sp. NPDC052308]|uniref:LLM class flavin-dependent oxidoreductase n=1 Tax=Actinoallomurus sp. NPDC052308 TaxID=3155530 RepID=UPI003425849D